MSDFRVFVMTLLAFDAIIVAVGSLVLPPDAASQVFLIAPALLTAPVIAWWLVYRDGFARLQGAVESDEE
ncbi:hypothetical protein ACFQJC_14130 [Haloferax namakaokahaiae]|uniref:Uncharacterized protein n=1 Tax=Haloferax namakaokahaiae TaxID=1748331 RepID=A0ABD5ZIE5_9EURY